MSLKGIYVLIIRLDNVANICVGALGNRTFNKGLYAYVGSAQKNIEQRVKRHLRKEKHKFWHIDYLLESKAAIVVEILYRQGDKAEECKVARFIANKGEKVNGFGCSDCRCESHLLRIVDSQFLRETMQTLNVKPEKLGVK